MDCLAMDILFQKLAKIFQQGGTIAGCCLQAAAVCCPAYNSHTLCQIGVRVDVSSCFSLLPPNIIIFFVGFHRFNMTKSSRKVKIPVHDLFLAA